MLKEIIINMKNYRLYHYTKLSTLYHISKSISNDVFKWRLSNYTDLNDKSETNVYGRFFINQKDNIINHWKNNINYSHEWGDKFFNAIEKLNSGSFEYKDIKIHEKVFISSFTHIYNCSTFWNTNYSGLDGCCITFDKKLLMEKCNYLDEYNNTSITTDEVKYIEKSSFTNNDIYNDITNVNFIEVPEIEAYVNWSTMRQYYKSDLWRNENEFRICQSIDNHFKITEFGGLFKFYDQKNTNHNIEKIELVGDKLRSFTYIDLPIETITGITLGCETTLQELECVKKLFQNYKHISVDVSYN